MSQNPLQQQASKAADAPSAREQNKNRELALLMRRARDLRIGLSNLTDLERRGVNCDHRRAMHAAKLAHVNRAIFKLLQPRLF